MSILQQQTSTSRVPNLSLCLMRSDANCPISMNGFKIRSITWS
uniref:Uncharacterized protein n=1 Tax=Arundo donax TaxID=35708 RepID=A0A0A9FL95_ARUDO